MPMDILQKKPLIIYMFNYISRNYYIKLSIERIILHIAENNTVIFGQVVNGHIEVSCCSYNSIIQIYTCQTL